MSLARHPEFAKLWAGQAISEIGSVVTRTALPIAAVLALGATPLEVGILYASGSTAVLLVGLAAGAWVDRLPRRPVMISADLGRAFVLGAIPLAAVLGTLRIELLYVASFASAALGAFFEAAYRSFPPLLVPRERLVDANSALAGASSVAEVAGPSLGGALVQFLSAPFAIAIDAASFVVSAISIALVRVTEPVREIAERARLRDEIAAGLGWLARERSLRTIALSLFVRTAFGSFFGALYAPYALTELAIPPIIVGAIVAAGGVSDLAASAFAGRATRRFGIGPTIVWAEVASAGFALLIPFAGGPLAALYLFVPQLLGDGLATASGINALTLRQLLAPPEMLGRVNAAMHVLIRGIAPVSAIAGALIAEALGIRTAVWITVLGIFGGALLMLLPSPLLRLRQPQDVAPNLMSETSSTRS